jgi:hypothetical protein
VSTVLLVFFIYHSVNDASRMEKKYRTNLSLIKLVLQKIKNGRKKEGTRKTDTETTSRSRKLMWRYIVGLTQSVHQGMMTHRSVSQMLAGRTSILLVSLYQS